MQIAVQPDQRYRILHPNERLSCEQRVYPGTGDFVRVGRQHDMLMPTPDHGAAQLWNIEGSRLGTHILVRAQNLPPEVDSALVTRAQGYVTDLGSRYGPSYVSPAYGVNKFVA